MTKTVTPRYKNLLILERRRDYGCEYLANILEQRARPAARPGPLHLTRRQDLLDLELPLADLTPYEPKPHS